MAYNTQLIVTDKDGNPISQYYNPTTDAYEPIEGSGGGNKVVLYNKDGTENNSLSLIPILDKLGQLTGTVIDEETRKSNELQRIALYDLIFKMLQDGELKGEQGIQGIQGETGKGLEFYWRGTELGVRVEGTTQYVYVDLKGETGSIDNLNAQDIEGALGYVPFNVDNVVNTLIETASGKALDARQGKLLNDDIATHKLDGKQHWKTLPLILEGKSIATYLKESIGSGAEKGVFFVRQDTSDNPSNSNGYVEYYCDRNVSGQIVVTLRTFDNREYKALFTYQDGTIAVPWERVITNKSIPWINATLENGWTGYLLYRKNAIGQLEIEVDITSPPTFGDGQITQLPVSHLPKIYSTVPLWDPGSGVTTKGIFIDSVYGKISVVSAHDLLINRRYTNCFVLPAKEV